MAKVKMLPLFTSTPAKGGLDTDGAWEQKQRLAEMLMQGDNAPVWSAGQGLTRVAKSLMGGWMAREAQSDKDRQENATLSAMREAVTGTTGLGDAPTPIKTDDEASSETTPEFTGSSGGRSGGGSRAAAANERARKAHARLVSKGYSEHAAAGIVANAMKESSMNTGAVGDNGTAFGLFQHRGPRFENLKKFAASQGKDWRDFDTNLDFADHEMRNGLDRGAAVAFKKLQTAKSAEEASDIFMNYFERPSKAAAASSGPQRRAFAASLIKSGVSPAAATAIASGEAPGAVPGAPQEAYAGDRRQPTIYPDEAEPMPDLPAPDLSAARSKKVRGQRLMATRGTFQAGLQLYQQGEAEEQELLREHQKLKTDLYRDARKERITDRRERDRRDWEVTRDEEKFQREQGAKKYTLSPGQRLIDADGKVIAEGPPKTDSMVEVGPDGSIRVGPGGKLTEGQTRDLLYHDRAVAAMADLDPIEDALTSLPGQASELLPESVQGLVQPERYQLARNAGLAFLASILRKDSGAALTKTDISTLGSVFLPLPGNTPDVLAQKRHYREVAIEAMKKGLGPAAVLAAARPDVFDGKSTVPKSMQKQGKTMADVQKGEEVDGYIYLGGDKTKPESWRKK